MICPCFCFLLFVRGVCEASRQTGHYDVIPRQWQQQRGDGVHQHFASHSLHTSVCNHIQGRHHNAKSVLNNVKSRRTHTRVGTHTCTHQVPHSPMWVVLCLCQDWVLYQRS